MITKQKEIKDFIIAVLFLFFISSIIMPSCRKKYPENEGIHLKKVGKRVLGTYHLTEYSVNGADSLSLLSSKFNQDVTTIEWQFTYKNATEYSIFKLPRNYKYPDISFEFRNKKSELFINHFVFYPEKSSFYNIFTKNFTTWKILKLYTKNKKPTLRLKGEFSGKTYIIEFT